MPGPWDKYATQDSANAGPWAKYAGNQQPEDDRGVVDKLFGIGGPRYQTWPERMVRGVASSFETGAELTKKAMTGQYGPTGEGIEQEDPGKIISAASPGVSAAPEAAGIVGDVANAASKAAATRAALPTIDAIKSSAKAAYKEVEDARLIASEGSVNNLVSATRAGLDQRLVTDQVAPRTFKGLEQLQKSGGDISQIMSVRQRLGEIKPSTGTDYEAAQHVRDAIDNYVDTLPETEIVQGDPQYTAAMLSHARQSWKSYAQLDQVQSAMEIGEHRAAVSGTGANSQNAMRQRIREILDSDKSRRYSPEAKQQMEDIVVGTAITNAARKAGKFAPTGPVSAMTTMGAALAGDLSGGAGMASIAAASIAIPATIAKYLGTYLTRQQIGELENIIRSESPLGQAATAAVAKTPPSAVSKGMEAAVPPLVPALSATTASPLAAGQQ